MKKKSPHNRVFVLGLDGATLEFIDRGSLPNFQKVIENSLAGPLISRPALTPTAWTSMVTGVNPGKHGIVDFRVGDRQLSAVDKKVPEIWDYVPSVVVNVPMTYPAKRLNGVMISGIMAPDLESEFVYPETERQYLKDLGYIIEAEPDLNILLDSINKRIELIKHYYERDWQLFWAVFREFDIIHQFFWGQDEQFYRVVDSFLGEYLLPRLEDDGVRLAIVSAYGYAPVGKVVNIEMLLAEFGHQDEYFVGGWGALYKKPNVGGKEELVYKLKQYRDENSAQILDVYLKEDVYWGPVADQCPDLLVWPKRELGYTFTMRSETVIADSAPKNGCHTENGLVVLHGFGVDPVPVEAKITDVYPTLMKVLGVNGPSDIDGKLIGST